MIAQLITKSDRLRVVVVLISGLVRERSVERHALIGVSFAIPNAVAEADARHRIGIAPVRIGIRKGVAIIEQGDAVYEIANGATGCICLCRRYRWRARNAVNRRGIRRQIWKQLGLRRVEIPRTHEVARES